MMLKHFFDISTGFRYKKMDTSSPSMYRDVHDQTWGGQWPDNNRTTARQQPDNADNGWTTFVYQTQTRLKRDEHSQEEEVVSSELVFNIRIKVLQLSVLYAVSVYKKW